MSTKMSPLMASPLITHIILTVGLYSVISVSSELTSDSKSYTETELDSELLCKGEWKFPNKCNTYNCDYKASWEYIDDNDEIMFTISTKNRNKWTGIGFSENQAMPETDAILGLVEESGRFFLMDSWLRAYEAPPLDQSQNLYNMSAWRENGITTLRFFRKRITGDNKDFQFTDTNCPYLIFPVMGGVFNAVNKRIRKHETTPIISDRKVCISSCKTTTTVTTAPVVTTAKPDTEQPIKVSDKSRPKDTDTSVLVPTTPTSLSTQTPNDLNIKEKEDINDVSFRIELKFPGMWKQSLTNKYSDNYKTLVSNIKQQMHSELSKKYPTFSKLDVKEVSGHDTDVTDAIASIDLDVQPNNNQNENTETYSILSTVLNAIISDEMLGDLRVDPKYLIIDKKVEDKEWSIRGFFENIFQFKGEEQTKWIIIFVGIAALIGLVLIQAICMLWNNRNNRKNKAKNDKTAPNSQYKDYADVTARSGYSYDNYGASDETDTPLNINGQSLGRSDKMTNGQNKQFYKNISEKMPQKYISATLERQPVRSQRELTASAYATHDRKEAYNRHFNQPSFSPQLQPDFYFMPHQRRYSGEVVRVFVDYNNPQFTPK